ncbi:tumor necrosis factor receptor superfamily member 11B-like [Mobula hypostoma]|uniref:tumor necrosis factor receptor superfamily member 11B-like n=1 Tax=Mobula hypostoma TaxID=723540 RepID=UPI002FC35F2B
MMSFCFCTCMLFILPLLLLPLVSPQNSLQSPFSRLYQYWDEELSQFYICEQCPPGTYREAHCNSSKRTECAPCPDFHYTAYWNSLDECQYCNVFCKEYQFVKHECNGTHNRVCECVEGRYFEFEFCLKHYECPVGFGVKKLGTPYTNTECMLCPKGFFSRSKSASEPCRKHTNCSLFGLKRALQGDASHDNTCHPCEKRNASSPECLDPPVEKDIALCDEAILKFIAQQKLTSKQLRTLMESLPGKAVSVQRLQWLQRRRPVRNQMFVQLKQWKMENPSMDTVRALIRALKKARAHNVYKKLLRRLRLKKVGKTGLVQHEKQ